jgi:hypothetical protein
MNVREYIEARREPDPAHFESRSFNFDTILDMRNARREIIFREDVLLLDTAVPAHWHLILFDNVLALTLITKGRYVVIKEVNSLLFGVDSSLFPYTS